MNVRNRFQFNSNQHLTICYSILIIFLLVFVGICHFAFNFFSLFQFVTFVQILDLNKSATFQINIIEYLTRMFLIFAHSKKLPKLNEFADEFALLRSILGGK